MNEIKVFRNGVILSQGRGRFDDFCVYLSNGEKTPYAPTDADYFDFLRNMAEKYGVDRIYLDFVKVYESTESVISNEVLTNIESIGSTYALSDEDDMVTWLSVLHLAMVAEENRRYAILGKRIKRLGVHQLLYCNFTAQQAADYSYGKKANELISLCEECGF